jgi:hypothetical protein
MALIDSENKFVWEGNVKSALVGAIVAYLLTEVDMGTGGGHFESRESDKIEAALMLS